MCSHSRVLYLVVHRQSWHCQTSSTLAIFPTISASISSKEHFLTPFFSHLFEMNARGHWSSEYNQLLGILTIVMKSTSSLRPWLVALKGILRFESFTTVVASIIDSTKTHVVCLNMVPDIGGNLGLEITVSTAVHSISILKDLWPKQVFEPCNHMPLWYLLLCRCHAFLDEQNLEQRGHV